MKKLLSQLVIFVLLFTMMPSYVVQANDKHLGDFGFPIEDPIEDEGDDVLFQDFSGGRIEQHANGNTSEGQPAYIIVSEYVQDQDKQYWEGYFDQLLEQGIYGFAINVTSGVAISKTVKAMFKFLARSPKFGAKILAKGGVKFIPFVGWGFLAYSVIVTADEVSDLSSECESHRIRELDDNSSAYYCGQRDAVITLTAIGVISESAARSTKVRNVFGVLSDEALELHIFRNHEFYQKFEMNEVLPSGTINDTFIADGHFAPYKNSSLVLAMRTSTPVNDQFVRFYREDFDNKVRSWIMRKTDVVDEHGALLPIEVIQNKFAVPGAAPTHVVDVNLPAGVDIRYGIAKAQPQLGLGGGGEQFEIRSDLSDAWFVSGRELIKF